MVEFPEDNDYRAYKQNGTVDDVPADEYVSGAGYQESMRELQPQARPKAGWQQKFAIVFLSLFGLSAVILWAVQFNSGLLVTKPLTADELAQSQRSDQEASAALLRNQDTDQDGLSDYNELMIYKTSPYLEDTDSDGISDKSEVDTGEDPNCPRGQECVLTDTADDTGQTSPSASADGDAGEAPLSAVLSSPENSLSADQQAITNIFEGTIDAPSLRALLKNSGMSAELLDQISDEQLLDMYRKTLESQQQ